MFLPPGFDRTLANEAADLVAKAYEQFDAFKKGAAWSLTDGYDTLAPLSARPAWGTLGVEPFGFVARNQASGNVFVVFRGTESLGDWLSNFAFNQVDHTWGKVEEGFSALYAQCSASVMAGVAKAAAAPNIFSTGHSLGGALATLAAADLAISGKAVQMYNFASPRVGNSAFADNFNRAVGVRWRMVNTEDIVPTIPLATPVMSDKSPPHGLFVAILMLARGLEFEHVGDAVSFTTHNGSITGNHSIGTYQAAL